MKKKSSAIKAHKVIFLLCCILLALIFWFVVKYNELSGLPLPLDY